MKSYLISIGLSIIIGCSPSPYAKDNYSFEEEDSNYNLDNATGKSYTNSCMYPFYRILVLDDKVVFVESHTICNKHNDIYKGDPYSYRGDPNPWDKVVNVKSNVENVKIQLQKKQK